MNYYKRRWMDESSSESLDMTLIIGIISWINILSDSIDSRWGFELYCIIWFSWMDYNVINENNQWIIWLKWNLERIEILIDLMGSSSDFWVNVMIFDRELHSFGLFCNFSSFKVKPQSFSSGPSSRPCSRHFSEQPTQLIWMMNQWSRRDHINHLIKEFRSHLDRNMIRNAIEINQIVVSETKEISESELNLKWKFESMDRIWIDRKESETMKFMDHSPIFHFESKSKLKRKWIEIEFDFEMEQHRMRINIDGGAQSSVSW